MIRRIIFLSAFLTAIHGNGQIFKNVQLERLDIAGNPDCKVAAISPTGDFLVTTTQTNKGLQRIDIASKKITTLTDHAGAGFQPVISGDGNKIVFRNTTFNEQRERMTGIKAVSADGKQQETLQSPMRKMPIYGFDKKSVPFCLTSNTTEAPKTSTLKVTRINSSTQEHTPVVYLDNLQLMIAQNGKARQLSPNGTDESYIWPSLSPDGTKILYFVSGEGAYVCNLDGQDRHFIAYECKAPQWYDDNTVIGMDDKDDGEQLISSCIVAYTLDGQRQRLTDPASLTMYPQCAPKAGIVACSTSGGQLHLIHLTK